MPRLRRYRIFLVLAVFSLIALYQFTTIRPWQLGSSPVDHRSRVGAEKPQKPILGDNAGKKPAQFTAQQPPSGTIAVSSPAAESSYGEAPKTSQASAPLKPIASTSMDHALATPPQRTEPPKVPSDPGDESQQGWENPQHPLPGTSDAPVHWTKVPERYPIPSESIIQLPTAKAKKIPKIQHEGGQETKQQKVVREARLAAVKEALMHTWAGYKKYAWLQDELRPVTGTFRNPFCGWAATLVDSLDTLWIMGLKEEFDEAARAVDQIDFTTSTRDDIPLFETTIRYLGGLISAYDVSDGKYRNLLDKAVQLAEVLMSAFDTPNHMPVTYYNWKPKYASKPQRAGSRVVLSEMGTLSVEFTRLAQITKEPRYYDAIARITNEFEAWQNNTRLPGMWPLAVDASGCRETYHPRTYEYGEQAGPPRKSSFDSQSAETSQKLPDTKVEGHEPKKDIPGHNLGWVSDDLVQKREEIHYSLSRSKDSLPMGSEREARCQPQGLTSAPNAFHEVFSLGGQSDSIYEYLPKEYMLLGGVNEQYKTMYEQAIKVVKKHMLYRPMTIDNRDILLSGSISISASHLDSMTFVSEGTHLTCFVGGMVAIGSKIFNRPDELEIAAKLTDGCVWAYNATATGIMPEDSIMIPCKSASNCVWDESKWWDALDPFWRDREERYKKELEKVVLPSERLPNTNQDEKLPPRKDSTGNLDDPWKRMKVKRKRQLDEDSLLQSHSSKNEDNTEGTAPSSKGSRNAERLQNSSADDDNNKKPLSSSSSSTSTSTSSEEEEQEEDTYIPPAPPTHEEYVKSRIENERFPPGFAVIKSRKYILRPEAIESVFIMYRVTGDREWQEKGWRMFQSIVRATRTSLGHTAIQDVTSPVPVPNDEMESFWSAETLKYFYLLFSETDVINLDDWVLNTEAHPFRRPKV